MSSRTLTRVLLSVLAGALCGLVVTCGVLLVRDGGPRDDATVTAAPSAAATSTSPSARSDGGRAREVLRRWDAARARAWTAGDLRGLQRLYAPRSLAGARDVAMLRAWTERGARLTGLTTQVLRLRVVSDEPRRLVLVVTDRVARATAAGAGPSTDLPRDGASTRRVALVRPAGRWVVESVSPEPRGRS